MAKKKQQDTPKPEPVTRNLLVPLTESEELKLGQDIADLKLSINKLAIEKKVAVSEFNKKIGGMEGRLDEMVQQLKDKTKEADVACEWRSNDPKNGLKSLYRLDTNARIETYPMNLLDNDEKAEDFVPGKDKKEK